MHWQLEAFGSICDKRVTETDVFTYSLTWVMSPSEVLMVHACTHHTKWASSNPSAITNGPKPTTCCGTKAFEEGEEPVSQGTKWCRWHDGPWNHHSKSWATIPWSVSGSLEVRALYNSVTTLVLCSTYSSKHSRELASFGTQVNIY